MIYWENRDSVDSVGNVSKADILRGIVNEKLATAAREILAVVERIVAGYEEEASGFREEIDRQRRQLEAFQPKVKLETPACPGVGDTWSLSLPTYDDGEEAERKEELPLKPQALSSRQSRADLKDPDYQMPSRSSSSKGQSMRRNPVKSQISGPRHQLVLRVRILEDPHTKVISKNVLKNSSVQELQCPQGLQEAEFLDLLRSTFPQLDGDKLFDVFTAGRSKKLQPLNLNTLTAEEINRSTGAGRSTLYIRLKTGTEEAADYPSTSACTPVHDETRTHVSSSEEPAAGSSSDLLSARVPPQNQDHLETESADDCKPSQSHDCPNRPSVDGAAESDKGGVCVGSDDPHLKPEKSGVDLGEGETKSPKTTSNRRDEVQSGKPSRSSQKGLRHCRLCGARFKSKIVLVTHAWSHADNPERLCGACGELSGSAEELRNHLQNHRKTYTCSICQKSFRYMCSLRKHASLHAGVRTYKCNICQKGFKDKSILLSHRRLHGGDASNKCEICQKSFANKAVLKVHKVIHTGEKLYPCQVCGKSYSDPSSAVHHRVTHVQERLHACQVCGKRFKCLKYLNVHTRIHTVRDKPYLCDICCKRFYTNGELKSHMSTHSEEKPYLCTECGKGFSKLVYLSCHMKSHTAERPYSCSECGKAYKFKSNLNCHLRTHTGQKLFLCGVCGKACTRADHLTVHMRTHNGERPYKCAVCGRGFTQSHCLNTHMKSHQGAENWPLG